MDNACQMSERFKEASAVTVNAVGQVVKPYARIQNLPVPLRRQMSHAMELCKFATMAITQLLTTFGTVVPPMLVEFALDLIGRLQQSHYPNNRAEYSNRSANRLFLFSAARANVP